MRTVRQLAAAAGCALGALALLAPGAASAGKPERADAREAPQRDAGTGPSAPQAGLFADGVREGRYGHLVASARACPGASSATAPVPVQERAMRCLINQARARAGVPALRTSAQLNAGAAMKTAAMVRCEDFDHDACGEDFAAAYRRSGFVPPSGRGFALGENIAYAPRELGAPQAVLLSWLESREHRSNLLAGRWRQQGVGLSVADFQGDPGAAVWSSAFGRR